MPVKVGAWGAQEWGAWESSAPPVAAKDPDDDNDCDNSTREDYEELQDLRDVHD